MAEVIGEGVVIVYYNDFHNACTLFILQLFSHYYSLAQSAELVVYLLQLVCHVALSHDTTTGLEPEFTVSGYKRTDGDGLVQ